MRNEVDNDMHDFEGKSGDIVLTWTSLRLVPVPFFLLLFPLTTSACFLIFLRDERQ